MVLKFSAVSAIFNLNIQKYVASREMQRKCPNLCQDTQENTSKSQGEPFEQYLKGNGDYEKCPKSIGDPLSNASRVTDTLWEMLE